VNEETLFRIAATASVDVTKQLVVANHVINIEKPDLLVKVLSSKVKVGSEFQFEVSFVNPLNKNLTECELKYDGNVIDNRHCEEIR